MSETNLITEDLPEHVIVEILSRLPVKKIIHCKIVCKKWLDLVSDSYFANLHLSRSPAGILIHHNPENECMGYKSGMLKWLEVEDELGHQFLHHMSLDLNLSPIFQNTRIHPVGSVDGLVCLWKKGQIESDSYICNPITREYMILPRHSNFGRVERTVTYCFGVGLLTQEYKVIRIIYYENSTSSSPRFLYEAEVYTLGTGKWRGLGRIPYFLSGLSGTFINGNAHWIIHRMESICVFNFDDETFTSFPSPPVTTVEESESIEESESHNTSLGVLKGCLCQCDIFDSQFTIWVMKEYGKKKSWHLEVTIRRSISPDLFSLMRAPAHLIKRLNDGTILGFFKRGLVGYSPETGTTVVDTQNFDRFFKGLIYRPTFLKLQNFESETVHVF